LTGLLIVISGPSAVGKDTVVRRLVERDPRLRYSVSYTTRPRRPYEKDGVHYSFVSVPEFQRLLLNGELLEHAEYDGHLYGTSRRRVEDARAQGRDVILKIDVQGAEQVRGKCPDGVFIFLAPPSMDELVRRRDERGSESPEDGRARQELAEREMAYQCRYDRVVVNDDLDRAVGEILHIIDSERVAA